MAFLLGAASAGAGEPSDGARPSTVLHVGAEAATTGPALVAPPKPAPSIAPAPSTALNAGTTEQMPAWYVPAWSARGAFVALTYVSATVTLMSGAMAIGFEIDRSSLASGLGRDACSSEHSFRPAPCGAIRERRMNRDDALDVTITGAVLTGLFAVVAAIVIRSDRSPENPTLVPSVSSHGGGIVVSAW